MRLLLALILALPALALDNSVTITNTSEATQTNQVRRVPRFFARGEIAGYPIPYTDGEALAAWQADVKTRWPDGTVQFAIVSFPYTLAASASVTVDFRNSSDPCHLGNQATCEAAALNAASMLTFNESLWGAVIEAQANPAGSSTLRSASARTIVGANRFTYWLKGPVVTEVVVEDVDRTYDFGWNCTANCTWPFDTATWADDTTNPNLHPMFVLTFPSGWAGVRVQYILANYWTTARRTSRYSIALKSGSDASETEWSHAGVPAHANAWWRKEAWDGTAPTSDNIDFNLPYMIHSRLVWPYDTGLTINASAISTIVASYESKTNTDFPVWCSATASCGNRYRGYSTTGGRADRGFFPQWEALWLLSMDPTLYPLVIGNADHVASQSLHLRESATGLTYYGSTDAKGLPLSIEARSTVDNRVGDSVWYNLPTAVGTVTQQGSSSGWGTDLAHMHTHAQLAYFASGEWFFMQEQNFLAHRLYAVPQSGQGTNTSRRITEGLIYPFESNIRAGGWMFWNAWRGYLAAPDGTPEKTYLAAKLDDALAIWEGYLNVTDGQHYAGSCVFPFNHATASKWCWGRIMSGYGVEPDVALQVVGSSGLESLMNATYADSQTSPWMTAYVAMALADICRMDGTRACAIRNKIGRLYSGVAAAGGVWLSQEFSYRSPVRTKTNVSTTLVGNITSSATSLTVAANPSGCPAPPFVVRIDSEDIVISAVDGTTWTTGGDGRGLSWSSAAAHTDGAAVKCYAQFPTFLARQQGWASGISDTTPSHTTLVGDGGSYYDPAAAAACLTTEGLSERTCEVFRQLWHTNEVGGYTHGTYSHGSDPRWRVLGDRGIKSVVATGGTGTATLTWQAPSGEQCHVHLGTTPPASSQDGDGETVDTSKGRRQSVSATGLSAATHYYRITCGSARVSGTVEVN